ncbi:EVE domain-containing protein [Candidatus Enterococcus murrayae]|uniref:UPF0310 protein JZO85_03490 n=1 Tax=Candidatus Enterococcus murrayae TaxID=2815321 RepID=A0ABS3HCZ7_9ENTE|nr:EVE domain-containing protein [Enterococcus sp. MJM16]MBO0451315.1 EVE domain-containing protein [Enterococcus sp. MJM16]
MKYWIGVASEEHVRIGVTGGFSQLCHGKSAQLKRMKPDDWLIYYAPKVQLKGSEVCQKFVAIGQVISDEVYQVEMFPGFFPYRKNVQYLKDAESCTLQKVSQFPMWAEYRPRLRFGHFEIPEELFQQIAFLMNVQF